MSTEKMSYFRFSGEEQYRAYLLNAPDSSGVKTRSIGRGSSEYCPVETVEALADYTHKSWYVMDESYSNVLNEIVCTVKIMALPDYPGADYITFTGSGSKPVQCSTGSKAEDFPKGKTSNALEYCLPAARANAIRCAFATLGNIFGRNVNRKSVTNDFAFSLDYIKE